MKKKITGFHQDEYEHWVADLSCGHSRHFRHDPPWQQREWVTSPQGRKTYIGFELDCKTSGSPDAKRRGRMKKTSILLMGWLRDLIGFMIMPCDKK